MGGDVERVGGGEEIFDLCGAGVGDGREDDVVVLAAAFGA